jgi:hypothetical protein
MMSLGNLLSWLAEAVLTAGYPQVWPIAWPKALKIAQKGLIQPSELRWMLKSTRNQLLPGGNVLPAVFSADS